MGLEILFALFAGGLASLFFSGSDGDEAPDDEITEDEREQPESPDVAPDTGASFSITETGIELELGEDETGSLAIIYYDDGEADSQGEYLQVHQALFYLVPEDVDLSETHGGSIPGEDSFEPVPPRNTYELADFVEHNGLELLGSVDLLNVLEPDQTPQEYLGEISANAPVESYNLSAETNGDELFRFGPADASTLPTWNGVVETPVTEDTTGTEGTDWFSTDTSGITIYGAGGDDFVQLHGGDQTILGGAGDDSISGWAPSDGGRLVIFAEDGDDRVSTNAGLAATVAGGDGDDSITIFDGRALGGEGEDTLRSSQANTRLYGGAGNDSISTSGVAFGDAGDDVIDIFNDAVGYGGEGDDQLLPSPGATADGGPGDDLFTVVNQFHSEDGPATVITGEGQDTVDVRVWNARGGEADHIYLQVTDFDPSADILQVGATASSGNSVDGFEIVEAENGSHTDVVVTVAHVDFEPSVAVIRLEGTTGLTADQVVVTG